MKFIKGLVATVLLVSAINSLVGQGNFVQTFENREEFVHLGRMTNGNLLVSGRSHELGNKSDLVLLLNPQGEVIKRVVLCPTCLPDLTYYSRETLVGDVIHVRANGDVYSSDLNLDNTELIYNIAEDRFESIQTYQVLEQNNFIIIVSFAVENSVRGLLHTIIDTRSKVIFNQKFNVEFPDIAGSIGIDLFGDQGVVDGFNTYNEEGRSTATLIRLGRDRTEQVWQVDLEGEDIVLEDATIAHNQNVYAVGTIQDPNDPDHRQGVFIGFDEDGNELWKVTFDADQAGSEGYTEVTKTFLQVREILNGNFIISGYDGGRFDGDILSKAIFMEVTSEGEFVRGFSESAITSTNVGSGFLYEPNSNITFIANAFNNSSNSGAYVSVADFTSDVDEVIAGATLLMSFQNPTTNRLRINLPVDAQLESNIEIYNYSGHRVISSESTDIDVSGLRQGAYLVTAVVNGYKVTQKMVKL